MAAPQTQIGMVHTNTLLAQYVSIINIFWICLLFLSYARIIISYNITIPARARTGTMPVQYAPSFEKSLKNLKK